MISRGTRSIGTTAWICPPFHQYGGGPQSFAGSNPSGNESLQAHGANRLPRRKVSVKKVIVKKVIIKEPSVSCPHQFFNLAQSSKSPGTLP